MPNRPRVLSGMQPTGDSLHLGNYLGALRYWVTLQETHDAFYCVVDLHSLTIDPEPATLRQRTRVHVAQFLAAGVDPDRSALFVQSHVPEHTELTWVLSCLTGYGEASRMTQFKDKAARAGAERTNVGLFTYPILQAADILIYQATAVPVGEDQRQHLELSRTLAQRFNTRYGETFVVPAAHIVKETAKITDLQHVDAKMSGSVGGPGCVWLSDDAGTVDKRIRSAVTDTETQVRFDPEHKPGVSNLLTILSAFTGEAIPSIEQRFAGRGYGDLKKETAVAVNAWLEPFQQRTARWLDDDKALDAVLAKGAARARSVAADTMDKVRDAIGLLPVRA